MKANERNASNYVAALPSARTLQIRTGDPPTRIQFPKVSRFLFFENGDLGQLSLVNVTNNLEMEATDENFTYNVLFDFTVSDDLLTTVTSLNNQGIPDTQIITIPFPPAGLTQQQFVDFVNAQLALKGIGLSFVTTDPNASVNPQQLEDSTTNAAAPVVADLAATAILRVALTEAGLSNGQYFEARARRTLPILELRCKEIWLQAIAPAGISDYTFEISIATGLTNN